MSWIERETKQCDFDFLHDNPDEFDSFEDLHDPEKNLKVSQGNKDIL